MVHTHRAPRHSLLLFGVVVLLANILSQGFVIFEDNELPYYESYTLYVTFSCLMAFAGIILHLKPHSYEWHIFLLLTCLMTLFFMLDPFVALIKETSDCRKLTKTQTDSLSTCIDSSQSTYTDITVALTAALQACSDTKIVHAGASGVCPKVRWPKSWVLVVFTMFLHWFILTGTVLYGAYITLSRRETLAILSRLKGDLEHIVNQMAEERAGGHVSGKLIVDGETVDSVAIKGLRDEISHHENILSKPSHQQQSPVHHHHHHHHHKGTRP